MAFVVCEPCRGCKYTDCVVVCPMNCFYQDKEMLYIDPNECIDCGACVPECPVSAIYSDTDVPAKWNDFIAINANLTAELIRAGSARVTEKQEPLK